MATFGLVGEQRLALSTARRDLTLISGLVSSEWFCGSQSFREAGEPDIGQLLEG